MSDTVIQVEGLYKKFCTSLKRSMLYGTYDAISDMAGFPNDATRLRKKEFWALQDINFELKRGETLGLIGQNGCGKTTLLRLLSGIFPPDKGKIIINGRIGALIAVGAGFHPHMTGRENIFLNGTILGMTMQEIRSKFDSIIDFAEIDEFLDAPVANYSSGMHVRLGFAIAIHCDPDIVLVDEILAVGDAKFQRKCLNRIREMRKNNGVSFILVTHNMQNIESMCKKAILIDKGKQIAVGNADEIIPVYELMLMSGPFNYTFKTGLTDNKNELVLVYKYEGHGTDEICINSVKLFNNESEQTLFLKNDDSFFLLIELNTNREVNNARLSMTFIYCSESDKSDKGISCLGVQRILNIENGISTMKIFFPEMQFTTGKYKILICIFDETHTNPYVQGFYGYFTVLKNISTMLRVGFGTPYCWTNPVITLNRRLE